MIRLLLTILALSLGPLLWAQPKIPGIPNFHEMSKDVWRGGRPDEDAMQQMAKQGLKTVLDLEDDGDAIESEQEVASALGIRFISEPMSGFWSPDDDTVNAAEAALADRADYPLFVHCQHGQDRTGLIIGLFRVFHEGWDPQAAYQEMLDLGFHPALFLLDRYYKQTTGMRTSFLAGIG